MTPTEKKVETYFGIWTEYAQELFTNQDWGDYVKCLKLHIDTFFEKYADFLSLEENMELYQLIEDALFEPNSLAEKLKGIKISENSFPPACNLLRGRV